MTRVYKTLEAHVGGQPLRLIVDGMPRPPGKTAMQKREWVRRHADAARRAVVLEPRGHVDMIAAVLTEATSPGADAGLIFMDSAGYPLMSGHGVIAAATLALERELFFSPDAGDDEARLAFETPAGTVPVRARLEARGSRRRVDSVTFSNVPSFVHTPSYPVRLAGRELRVDVAFGGGFYAIADTESIGIPLRPERVPELRRLGAEIRSAIDATFLVEHPVDAGLNGIAGVVFTGPPEDPEAHLRSVTVTGGTVDRSPGGTGTSAVMAVLDAMGLLPADQIFVHESLTGALFRGQAMRRTQVGDLPALIPTIEGSAWVTGEGTFVVDEDDPFRDGFSF